MSDDDVYWRWRWMSGWGNVLGGGVSAVLYLLIMHSLRTEPDFSSVCYSLLFYLGWFDLQQVAVHIAAGLRLLLDYDWRQPIHLQHTSVANKVCGGMAIGGWQASIGALLLVAVNRLLVMTDSKYTETVFSKPMVKVYIGLCWAVAISSIPLCVFDVSVVMFDPSLLSWIFVTDLGYSGLTSQIDFWFTNIATAVAAVLYAVLYAHIKMKHAQLNVNAAAAAHRRRELNLAVQATLITCVVIAAVGHTQKPYHSKILNSYWHVVATFGLVSPDSLGGPAAMFTIGDFALLLCNTMNPFIYIIFNAHLRRCVLRRLLSLCGWKKPTQTTTVVPINHHHGTNNGNTTKF